MNISIHGLIGECNEEYRRRQQHAKEEASETQSAYANTQNSKALLAQRIGGYIQFKNRRTGKNDISFYSNAVQASSNSHSNCCKYLDIIFTAK